MDCLEHITIEKLHEQLEKTDKGKPKQRILAIIAYKQGESKKQLAKRYNVSWKTIQNWIDRFKEQPIEKAPYNEKRPGRPSKLTDTQKEKLIEDLHKSPKKFNYNKQEWFPSLVYDHIKEKFGIEYSLRHIRRLMNNAGLSWRKARPQHKNTNPEKKTEFKNTVEKNEDKTN